MAFKCIRLSLKKNRDCFLLISFINNDFIAICDGGSSSFSPDEIPINVPMQCRYKYSGPVLCFSKSSGE